jgi:proteasome accessory factor B
VGISKIERMLNLVIALLSTRNYITAERIRQTVLGYADCPTDEAFSRMFERDKNELRDLGIPLETGRVSNLDADEAAAVAVAVQLWQSPELVTATQGALLKLRAAGVDVDAPDISVSIASSSALPGIRGSETVLPILLGAIDSGQAVQFQHRASRVDPYTTRTMEPWAVVTDRGRWYLVGKDRDRDAVRTFRLSRIGAEVTPIGPVGAVRKPDGVDVRDIVAKVVGESPTGVAARIWVAGDKATALRRAGAVVQQMTLRGRAGDVLAIDVGSVDRLAREVAGYGADAVVLEPESLREEVIARLRAQAGRSA